MLFHSSKILGLAVIISLYREFCSSSWFDVNTEDKFTVMNSNAAELLCVHD
jgi:hypothetical protein